MKMLVRATAAPLRVPQRLRASVRMQLQLQLLLQLQLQLQLLLRSQRLQSSYSENAQQRANR
jgi:hypothetical protein